MPEYLQRQEGDLEPMRASMVEDIDGIQSNVSAAFLQLIIDNEGPAFILDENPDAFEMAPIVDISTDIFDQEHTTSNQWQDIQDMYVKQTIDIVKSSILNIQLKFKNLNVSESINVNTELIDLNDNILASYTLTVPANQEETTYTLLFNVDHLPEGSYYLKIKRTNVDGVRVKYDANGGYNQGMYISANDSAYNPIGSGADLWFRHEYASQSSFDITSGLAVVQGIRTYNLDTHVTIPPASAYGDRIDLVIMHSDGEFEVIEGEAGTDPEEPDWPDGTLKIGYVTVYKNSPLAVDMDLDQTRDLDRTRTLNLIQKVRELERQMAYVMDKNSPDRIKYNLSGGSLFDPSLSTNIEFDPLLDTCILSNSGIQRESWPIIDNLNFTASNVDHSDDTSTGGVTLGRTTYSELSVSNGHGNRDRDILTSQCFVYKDRSRLSKYPAGFFTVTQAGYLTKIKLQPMYHLGSIAGGRLYLMQGNTVVATSSYLPANQWSYKNWIMTEYEFASTWLEKGNYYWVLYLDPTSYSTPGRLWVDAWRVHNTSGLNLGKTVNNSYGEFIGWYPNMRPSGYVGNGLKLANRPGKGINFEVYQNVPGYKASGSITSSPVATDYGIATVMEDVNMKVPNGTYYELKVSNDGGTTFFKMTGKTYTFSNQTGQSFVWKLTLYTNDTDKSPKLFYDAAKQYAARFTLGLADGSPAPLTGQLVTKTFDGPRIIQYALGYAQTPNSTESIIVDAFSHWDWLRMWVEENAGDVTIDIEGSVDGSAWKFIRAGLTLDDIPQEPTLYGESIDPDEYNYWCDIDVSVLTDEEIIESCEEAWTSAQGAHVVCTADTEKYQGTYSAKMAMDADATTGLLAYRPKTCSLVNYEWLEVYFYSSIALDDGDVTFNICSDALGATPLESFDLPALSATTWTYFRFKLNDPSNLGEVKSFSVDQNVDKGAFNFHVDSIKAMLIGMTIVEPCDAAWTADKTDPGLIHVSRDSTIKADSTYSSKMVINSNPGTGLMQHIVEDPTLDLSYFKQLRIWFYSTVNLEQGDYSLLIGENEACTTILEEHNLPAVSSGAWKRITIDLDDPEALAEVASFGLKLNNDAINSGSFYIDSIQGLTSEMMPFYTKYVRMRFNLSRDDAKDISPSIRKVGVIPHFT